MNNIQRLPPPQQPFLLTDPMPISMIRKIYNEYFKKSFKKTEERHALNASLFLTRTTGLHLIHPIM